jgi:hypothetical protein
VIESIHLTIISSLEKRNCFLTIMVQRSEVALIAKPNQNLNKLTSQNGGGDGYEVALTFITNSQFQQVLKTIEEQLHSVSRLMLSL